MFRTGYLTVARPWGIPIQLHWSIPVGAFVFGRFQIVPGFWLAFFLLVLIHELGHAMLVRRYHLAIEAVQVHGLGGVCAYSGYPSALERSIIAWGGVLAQAVLLGLTYAFVWTVGSPASAFGSQMIHAFTWTNLIIMGINLLPIRPLDGAEAWKVFGLMRNRKYQKKKDDKRRLEAAQRRERWDAKRGGKPSPHEEPEEPDVGAVEDSIREALGQAARDARERRKRREGQK